MAGIFTSAFTVNRTEERKRINPTHTNLMNFFMMGNFYFKYYL
jgi:hypothetical protein